MRLRGVTEQGRERARQSNLADLVAETLRRIERDLPDVLAGATGDRPVGLTLDDRQEGPDDGGIGHAAVLDPYQRAEGRHRLMRGIIEALIDHRNSFSILTKGTLILRDVDLLQRAAEVAPVSVAFSIGILDEEVWRSTEPGTPNPRARIEAIRTLSEAGIPPASSWRRSCRGSRIVLSSCARSSKLRSTLGRPRLTDPAASAARGPRGVPPVARGEAS